MHISPDPFRSRISELYAFFAIPWFAGRFSARRTANFVHRHLRMFLFPDWDRFLGGVWIFFRFWALCVGLCQKAGLVRELCNRIDHYLRAVRQLPWRLKTEVRSLLESPNTWAQIFRSTCSSSIMARRRRPSISTPLVRPEDMISLRQAN